MEGHVAGSKSLKLALPRLTTEHKNYACVIKCTGGNKQMKILGKAGCGGA
jgi:hypothetical protein